MGLNEDIHKLLEDFGVKTVPDLQQSLRDKGVTKGGQDSNLSAKIRYTVTQKGKIISFSLIMPEYGEAVDKGRKAAGVSKEGQESIGKWGKSRGYVGQFATKTLEARLKKQSENKTNRKKKVLKKPSFDKQLKSFIYVVARKLKEKGYKGNGFYSEVIEDGRLDKLKQDLSNVLKSDIEIEIINLAKI